MTRVLLYKIRHPRRGCIRMSNESEAIGCFSTCVRQEAPNLFTSSFWFFLLSPTTIQCLSDRIDVAYNVGPLLILFSFLRLNEGRYRFPRYPLPTYAFISRLNASKTNICLRNMPPLLQLFEAQHGADFFMACSISASWSASRAS